MKHDLHLEGHAFRLRPVGLEDAEDILALRLDPALNRFLHPTPRDPARQRAWLDAYFTREGDYYFAVERRADDRFEGVVAVYDLDQAKREAEWGRWILKPGSMAAVESALLVYRAGFERLDLAAMFCRTVAMNAPVLSFHDSSGARRVRTIPDAFVLQDGPADAVEHRVERDAWPRIEAGLDRQAARLTALLERRSA